MSGTRSALRILHSILLVAVCETVLAAMDSTSGHQARPVVHQLRIYEIFDHNKQAFHDRFRDHALRIMAKYDFVIVAMWESRTDGRTEFVYLLEWPDRQTMTDSWARFMADQEWAEIKRRTGAAHGKLVGKIEDRTLLVTDYSPLQQLIRPTPLTNPGR